ncbi:MULTISPECIES: hypothetical protein [Arsenicicoccus]|uniref:hypothetical protein n=1 Tax=Arsenicicoccus TaxID=267408 RepID=UPI00257D0841|nr:MULTISPECIES: hypothetical protein [Arsenicicoccus]
MSLTTRQRCSCASTSARGLGETIISGKEYAVTPVGVVLPASGLDVPAGTVAGVRWTFTSTTDAGVPFLHVVNEQTVVLGLGAVWRQSHEEPSWTVEIHGDPAIRCQLAIHPGSSGADPAAGLNAARAVNFIPRLSAAAPGFASVLDVPAPRGFLAGS